MACSLCYVSRDTLIDLNGDEAKQLHIASVLFKYFSFCFSDEPNDGYVCRKCWVKVDVFHQFYVHIEEIQGACFKNEDVDAIKCDITSSNSKDLINEESELYENDEDEDFNLSDENDYYDTSDESEINISKVSRERNTKSLSKSELNNKVKAKQKQKLSKRKSFECEHCEDEFLTIGKLKKHQKQNHAEFAFRCHHYHCVETFMTTEQLEKHKAKHVKVACPQCGKMIQSKGMRKHIRQIHEIDQRVVCDLCGKVSSTIHMHKYHVRADHEVHERLQCDICKEWYKNKENLRSHMKSIHVEGPQTCTICGRISTNMKALAKHKKIHLEGSKERFKCIVCGKGFRDRTKLKEHSYIHSGVTDAYVCQFCGKAFRFGSSMYAHRKKAHPNEMSALKPN